MFIFILHHHTQKYTREKKYLPFGLFIENKLHKIHSESN